MSVESILESYEIGSFGDARRKATGEDLFRAIVSKGTLIVKQLGGNRSGQVRFERFLWSDSVTFDEIKSSAIELTRSLVDPSSHVLCLQDSTEIDLSRRKNDISPIELGLLKNRDQSGFYFHPVLAIDAKDEFVLGLAGLSEFDYGRPRERYNPSKRWKDPIESKKSYRWIQCANEAKETLSKAQTVTLIGDRESDFYEFYARVPEKNFHTIVRCKGDRVASTLDFPGLIFKKIDAMPSKFPVADTKSIELRHRAAITAGLNGNKRPPRNERTAVLDLKYGRCTLHRPKDSNTEDPETTDHWFVEVIERESSCENPSERLKWLLITSHKLSCAEDAWQIVDWYKKRWHIEQLFRTAKKGGLRIESIELSKGDAIKKLCLLGLLASVRILQMTLCRNGEIERPAAQVFSHLEIKLMEAAHSKYEGKTQKQKNPHPKETIAWSHWILARMGGWMGYIKSEGPAGPITLKRGLDELYNLERAWQLFKNVCIT